MRHERIVLIEDESDIREVIEYNLMREGYCVFSCADGEEGLRLIRSKEPDLALLDLMLPCLSGFDVCRRVKSDPMTQAVRIIMVTAKGEENDIVQGLRLGADDYVTKPFSPKELLARIEAVLRRTQGGAFGEPDHRIVRDDVVIDINRHEVRIEGKPVTFTKRELHLLYYLASRPGAVFTRDHLLRHVIGEDIFIVDRNIDVHVRAVRRKLGKFRNLIETIRGVGYRFRDREE